MSDTVESIKQRAAAKAEVHKLVAACAPNTGSVSCPAEVVYVQGRQIVCQYTGNGCFEWFVGAAGRSQAVPEGQVAHLLENGLRFGPGSRTVWQQGF